MKKEISRPILTVIAICIIVVAGSFLALLAADATPRCGNCPGAPFGLQCPIAPCPGHEAIVLMSFSFDGPTNASLVLQNTGQMTVGLDAYSVQPSSGVSYSDSNWTGPSPSPNEDVVAHILIDGRAFTFQSGDSYTITLTSTRNNSFSFKIGP